MKKIYIITILCLLSFVNNSVVSADDNIYSQFLYPTYINNNKVIYFNQYDGAIYSNNIINGDKESIFDLIPSDTSILQISPDNKKMLLYTSNISYPKYNAPFFDPTQTYLDKRWWIYNFNTQDKKILNEKISLATWYSDDEIIYVFDNKDISIAPISNLNNFKTVYSRLPSTVDTNKIIIANSEHQIVPLKDGYIIGNNNKFQYIKNNDYNIVANPNLEIFLEYNNNQLNVIDWNGNQKSNLDNINIKNGVVLNNNEFVVLLQNGQLIKYNLKKEELAKISIKPVITDIYSIGESDSSLLIQQDNEISLYNINTKEKGISLSMGIDDNNSTTNTQTPLESENSSNSSNIILLIGGILFLVAGIGVFFWKSLKR